MGLVKLSSSPPEAPSTELQPHQRRALDRLFAEGSKGLVAYHSMGSGKTLTALEALRRAGTDADKLVVVPASLVDNVRKESEKHGVPIDGRTEVLSYERAANRAAKLLKRRYGLVVLDEAHRMRNASGLRAKRIASLLDRADRKLLMTGTAGYNHPADVAELVRLIDRDSPLPADRREFEARYVNPATWKVRRGMRKELADALGKYVDVYSVPRDSGMFPEVVERYVDVPMTRRQRRAYDFVARDLPPKLRRKVENSLPASMEDVKSLNVFSSGMRQVSTSPMRHDVDATPEDSGKLVAAARSMLSHARSTPSFRGVAYSNYIGAGLKPYAELLRKGGLDPLVFTGALDAKGKKALVDAYNADGPDPRVLLLSSSGAEGLDLKGTRLMQVLEPHFNRAKIDQVTARGARYGSHAHLPESERTMEVERYRSVMPKGFLGKVFGLKPEGTIDVYLDNAALKKKALVEEMRALAEGRGNR